MEVVLDGKWVFGADSASYDTPQGYYQWSQNVVNTGGLIQTRQGFAEVAAVSQQEPRGLTIATLGGVTYLVAAIGDKIYKYNFNAPNAGLVDISPDVRFPTVSTRRAVHFELCVQARETLPDGTVRSINPKFVLVIQDGVSDPCYWDGQHAGKIKTLYPETSTTVKGDYMKWVGDRLWVVKGNRLWASDLLNPLQFEETDVTASGGFFFLSSQVTGMGVTHDYKSLLVFTHFTTSAFQVGIEDRTLWPSTQDFQRQIFPSIGCASHRTIINQYGITWWMSHDGLVGLDNALQAYQTSRMQVRDGNMARSKDGLRWGSGGGCAGNYGNYLFFSVPSGSRYNVHTWVLDQSPIEKLNDQSPPAWASNWTGIRPEQWTTGIVGGVQRCFCISRDLTNTGHQSTIWEAFIGQRMDVPKVDAMPKAKDIGCCVETRFLGLSPAQFAKFMWVKLDIAEIIGNVHLQVYYCGRRTSYKKILDKKLTATVSTGIEEILNPDDPLNIWVPQHRVVSSVTDSHDESDLDSEVQTPFLRNRDREFSLLIMWTGQMALAQVRVGLNQDNDYVEGTDEEQETLSRRITAEGAGQIGPNPPVDNAPTGAVKSQFLSPLRPRWVEFPAYDSAVPNGVFFVSELIATPAAGEYPSNEFPKIVTLTTETLNLDQIRFTLDGSTPTVNHGQVYSNANKPQVPMNGTLKARGFKQGLSPSPLFVGQYLQAHAGAVTATPSAGAYPPTDFSPTKAVVLSTTVAGSKIRWSINNIPAGFQNAPVTVHVYPNNTITAHAEKQYYLNGPRMSARYTQQPKCATPTLDPDGGAHDASDYPMDVAIATTTQGAHLRYTINDTEVLDNGTNINANHGTVTVQANDVLRVMAQKQGFIDSAIKTATYTLNQQQVSEPHPSPDGGTLDHARTITLYLHCSTPNAVICYTAGGATVRDPDPSVDQHYRDGDPVQVHVGGYKMVKTQAYKAGMLDSIVHESEFEVDNGN